MWDCIWFTWQSFGSGVDCRADICENVPEAFLMSNKASSNQLQMDFPKLRLFCPWTVTGELFLPVFQPFVIFSLPVQLGKGSDSSCSGFLTLSQGQLPQGFCFKSCNLCAQFLSTLAGRAVENFLSPKGVPVGPLKNCLNSYVILLWKLLCFI